MLKNKYSTIWATGILLLSVTCCWAQNEAPEVNAGENAVAGVGRYYPIGGLVVDDGKPERKLSISWSKVSGPGEVAFKERAKFVISGGIGVPPTNPIEVAMSGSAACFTNIGTYVLRLSASDMELSTSDEVTIRVVPAYGTMSTLSEDFSAADIASLTSGVWTVENHSAGNQWELNSSTGLIEATGTAGVTQDTWLISPTIDCSSHSNVYLELTECLKGGSPSHWSYGYVLGSIDGGTSWTAYSQELHSYPVGTPEEETTEQSVTLNMDWADGQANVRMAWRYYANDDSWWRLNNVHVMGDLPGMIVPDQMRIVPEPNRYSIDIPTEPGKLYTIEYTDQPLSSDITWSVFADQSHGVGCYEATNTVWGSFTFVDDMGASTSGGEPVNGSRYYRIRIEDIDP